MRPPRLPRTLRARITAGLVVLLALACLAVGVTTSLALRGFLVGRLDQQLTAAGGRFATSLEHGERPDADNAPDTRGQAEGTLGVRLPPAGSARAAVVREGGDTPVRLTPSDRRALAEVPPDARGRSLRLSALGDYRVVATRGDDRDTLITGLPLHPVEDTVHRLELVEVLVFGSALLVTGVAGALWVRLSLRPLRRVAGTATEVTGLPLSSGEVAMPDPVPDADPRTEVGQVAAALNRMLGHVGDALARRHASEERLRRFAADASHELRTPVATVRAHSELALRHTEGLPEEVRHALLRIQSESRRMSVLVDDLLLLARLDAGRPLAREPVDLTRLALDAVDDARVAGPDHHWRLDLPAEPVTVTGDEHRLHQVIANLLANARIHTPPGTDVTLRLARFADRTELSVTDSGPGIAPALQEEVFQRFSRADTGRSRAVGGTGLGLAIVAAVIAAHGGETEVSSRPGRTEFLVRLPEEPA
ncbi:sensor histidine kinase [Streptomyces palmae]|uniref:histidine kinase n=1 Tax=Streptomyces palmae TaxID=1701085 RepID=A0A4Z0H7Z9_9ACTN|nr:HAMP domain-containing sensor histidine kinase [Streptomyces palmae]TGB07281.1 HAMP domain-containing histidine kinase [Streptomyces palmae]